MTATTTLSSALIGLFAILALTSPTHAIQAQTKPLSIRVQQAQCVFVGKVIHKAVEGDWARAQLLVEEPLAGVKKGQKVDVLWRLRIASQPLFDTPEGSRGIAILTDLRDGRYWLRHDRFEDLKKIEEVRRFIQAR
ncbi:MAG: hypothetical protein ACQKBU_11935 [Verrucomicrobiales bacterium]